MNKEELKFLMDNKIPVYYSYRYGYECTLFKGIIKEFEWKELFIAHTDEIKGMGLVTIEPISNNFDMSIRPIMSANCIYPTSEDCINEHKRRIRNTQRRKRYHQKKLMMKNSRTKK